ncbi:hypothetical protein KSP40_PGU007859 [Platanthera guangdongensis]|uniref:Uncharacterized protein n=1 Tax=Platanthera guangdongensis TaxID=2320717 RepID=A0ABR2MTL8_9ASPA
MPSVLQISEEASDEVLDVEGKYNENFSTNPYFERTKLSKFNTFFEDGTTNIAGTSIKWKEGMVSAVFLLLVFIWLHF